MSTMEAIREEVSKTAQMILLIVTCLGPIPVLGWSMFNSAPEASAQAEIPYESQGRTWMTTAPIVASMAMNPIIGTAEAAEPSDATGAAGTTVEPQPEPVATPVVKTGKGPGKETPAVQKVGNDRPAGGQGAVASGGAHKGAEVDRAGKKCKVPEPAREGLEAHGDGRYTIDRAILSRLASHPGELDALGWVAGVGQGKDKVGFKVGGLKCNNLAQQAGFRNGDVVRSINGRTVTSIPQAISAYFALKNKENIKVEITRAGKPLTLTYRIA